VFVRYHGTMTTNETTGGLRGLLDTLWRIQARNEHAVLGIVTGTSGSTYQKVGALVLLDGNGLRHGAISGGCLEPALEDAAKKVYETRRAARATFDTSGDEDLLFGTGIGCRGRVELLLLPLPPQAPLARALFEALDRGAALCLSFAQDEPDLGAGRARLGESDSSQWSVQWGRDGHASETSAACMLDIVVAAPPRVLLLGAGPETAPLAWMTRRLGWFIDVVEHRGRWAAYAKDAAIDRMIGFAPEAAMTALAGERYDAVVAMSHNYSIDLAWLRFCASTQTDYVGLLGPQARRDALLGELDADVRARLEPRLHAPVGLDLGGHGGEAVALAIVAQLQQHFSSCASSRAAASGQ
jgi:xanthine dehydrogenase accessory factor